MTNIKGRHVIFEDIILRRNITKWIEKAGGKTCKDISEIFDALNMAFPISLTKISSESLGKDLMTCETADGKKIKVQLTKDSMLIVDEFSEENGTKIGTLRFSRCTQFYMRKIGA